MIQTFQYRSRIPAPANAAFAWHARVGAFERLNPPWEPVEVIYQTGGIRNGDQVTIRMKLGPLPIRWTLEHRDYVEGERFRDVQISGPFASWEHTHQFIPDGDHASYLEDTIKFELPLGALGRVLGESTTRRKLERLFQHRHAVTRHDIETHRQSLKGCAMKIIVSGATGLVGSTLIPFLTTGGNDVRRLRRTGSGLTPTDVAWDPDKGLANPDSLGEVDAIVHLAGENIAAGRWTKARKAIIRDSRVTPTRRLCESLAAMTRPPRVLVCASAIGFYGDRGGETLDESSPGGRGFLAETCREWEDATDAARNADIRVVNTRFGVILSSRGGALAKMLTPFRLCAGGVVGSGLQYMSWIGIDDAIRAVHHAITTDGLSGPVNVVAPTPVTNAEFTRTLGRVLHRPTIIPMPAFAARLAFGEMADELLLSSARVAPRRLSETGFSFQDSSLEPCLRRILGA